MTVNLSSRHGLLIPALAAAASLITACDQRNSPAFKLAKATPNPLVQNAAGPDACQMVLVPHQGEGRIDHQIRRLQDNVRNGRNASQSLENLGWSYVAKARESFDPGFYKLAEECAFCLESRQPRCPEALLLRGHVLQNLHKFKEAEPLARELTSSRGLSFDYGLLGDVLMEQGRLAEAGSAYQRMVDQKPDMQAYARIAHLRWLKGDMTGAITVIKLATSAASPNAPESAAWVHTRLAQIEFQNGDRNEAFQACEQALSFQKDYAPALLLLGRLHLAEGHTANALQSLKKAAELNPLPEYQWVLSEVLRVAGQAEQAAAVDQVLCRDGAASDPRTFALYLASRAQSLELSLKLAREEFNERGDVFTHDALAWSLQANGQHEQAWQEMRKALAERTKDARLFLHAAVIALNAGHAKEGDHYFAQATRFWAVLLPSEQEKLRATQCALAKAGSVEQDSGVQTATLFTPAN